MNFYGTIRSFVSNKGKISKIVFMICCGIVVQPVKVILEIVAILWGLFTPKNEFVVVDKNILLRPKELPNTI